MYSANSPSQCPFIIPLSINRAIPLNKCLKMDYLKNEYVSYTCINETIYKNTYSNNECLSSALISSIETNEYHDYNCNGNIKSCNYVKLLSYDTCIPTNYNIHNDTYHHILIYELTNDIYQTSNNTNYFSTCSDHEYIKHINIATEGNQRRLSNAISNGTCPLNGADVVFLVDDSCHLSTTQCQTQQHGISQYMQYIKYNGGHDIKLSYATFDAIGATIHIGLDHVYNHLNNITSQYQSEYAAFIENMECGTGSMIGTNTYQALSDVMLHLNINDHFNKKIVIFSNCMDNIYGEQAICNQFINNNGLITETGDEVEVTVINILNAGYGNIEDNLNYLSCLTTDEPERKITLNNTNMVQFMDNLENIQNAVCENDTPNPTINPTISPTNKPTSNPTITATNHPS